MAPRCCSGRSSRRTSRCGSASLAAAPPSRSYSRFRTLFHWNSHDVATRYCYIDYDREVAIVAEVNEGGTRKLIGVGRLIADADHETVEYAVLIATLGRTASSAVSSPTIVSTSPRSAAQAHRRADDHRQPADDRGLRSGAASRSSRGRFDGQRGERDRLSGRRGGPGRSRRCTGLDLERGLGSRGRRFLLVNPHEFTKLADCAASARGSAR